MQRCARRFKNGNTTLFQNDMILTTYQCDGHRPSCERCARTGVLCAYDVEPDISRLASFRRRNDVLQSEIDLLFGLIDYIRKRSETEAQEAFRRIRASADLVEVAKSLTSTP